MLQPKNILITGATGNLGSVVSQYFLDKGFTVIGTARNAGDALQHTAFHVYPADLSDEAAAARFITEASRQHGPIGAALLLAGGFAMGDLQATSSAAIREQLALNFETAYHVARPLAAHMEQNGGGRIVFTGARPALEPARGTEMIGYTLSKTLLVQLAKIINAQTGTTGVSAALIAPGTIDTPANRKAMPDADTRNWVSPLHIASILHFLVTDGGKAVGDAVLKLYREA